VGRGEGRSKKQAEQAAAREAWKRLAGAGLPTGLADDAGSPPTAEEDDA
jgi:hypothetical protein